MLRPQLYTRLLAALPEGVLHVNREVERIDQDSSRATLHFADGSTHEADLVVGADGIDSLTRRIIWGSSDKREHNLHIFGGFTFDDVGADDGLCIISHNRVTQGSWTAIRHEGRVGHQWWTLTATDGAAPFDGDYHAEATRLGADFLFPVPELIAATDPANVQRWVIRDRPPLDRWSQGRITLVGDAAHPTSPYAAYGAGMAIEDGFFLGRRLAGVDLRDQAAVEAALSAYEEPRKPHTAFQSTLAYRLGRMFHHLPAPLRPVRDFVFDRTPFLQKMIGEQTPKEILDQIAVIDQVEDEFRAALGRNSAD